MVEECFDEEVLFENSPLSQYLRETCPDKEFETVPAAGDKKTQTQRSRSHSDGCLHHLHVIKGVIGQAFQWICPPITGLSEDVNAKFLPQYSALGLESGLLLDADRQMIHAYRPQGSQDARHRVPSSQPLMVWVWGRILCALAIVCASLSVLVPYLSAASETSFSNSSHMCALLCIITLLSSAAYAFYWTWACWIVNSLRRLHRESIGWMEQCMRLLDQQGVLLRRSIRYVQEVEVISRGFTMVGPYTPVVRLENTASSQPNRQCIVLRKSCFCAARAQYNALRSATLKLLEQHPLVSEVDHVGNYLAMVQLGDVAPWIEVNDDREDEPLDSLSELTGCFSLAALKAVNSLFLEQRSEFIRRLVLCMCPAAQLKTNMTVDSLKSWMQIVSDVSALCDTALGKLQRSYDCHRQRPNHSKDKTASDKLAQGSDGTAPQCRVNNAVHSLRLHLEATLSRVISVEEALEGCDSQHQADQGENISAIMSEMLDAVKRELAASQDCLEEAALSLEKMTHKQESSKPHKQAGDGGSQQSNADAEGREPIPLLPLRDAEIEFDDQIFEAYTDTEPGERCDEEWGESISEEEKMRRRREAEETKRMLQELRSVLSVRKAERERMKSERNLAAKQAKSGVDSGNMRGANGELTHAVESKDKWTGVAKNNASAIDVGKEIDKSAMLATKGTVIGDISVCDLQSGQDKDASSENPASRGPFSPEEVCGFGTKVAKDGVNDSSRDVGGNASSCSDQVSAVNAIDLSTTAPETEHGRQADASGDSVRIAGQEPTPLVSARDLGSFTTKAPKLEQEVSSQLEGNDPYSSQLEGPAYGRCIPEGNAPTSRSSPDNSPHVEKNQATDGDTALGDAPMVGFKFFPSEGQKRLGLSFLPSLAAEAASKSRHCQLKEETFIGSDEDSE